MEKSGNHNRGKGSRGRPGWKITLPVCIGILLSGAGLIVYIFSTEPTAGRAGATRKSAMLVDVAEVEKRDFRPTIEAMGTVMPAQDIILSPRVSGEIVERSETFVPGGRVTKGTMLLRVDPSDYQYALQQKESRLQQAVADLQVEMGRQNIARREYNLLEQELASDNRALVLRKPQLNAARAEVEAARAAVHQARLDLQRTEIKAPFDAQVISRKVNVGSQVAPGDNLGRLVGINTYWVEATVPLDRLRWLSLPDKPGETGAEVRIRNRTAWPEGVHRTGHLYKVIGEIEGQTRLARVLVAVEDPLASGSGSPDFPALMIGSFLETRIRTREIPDVIRLNRDYIRSGDTVWVMKDGRLDIREVGIVFRDAEYAYISQGLEPADRVVTTNLATVVQGAGLRLQESGGPVGENSSEGSDAAGKREGQSPGGSAE